MFNTAVNFCGVEFKNPAVTCSGTFGNGQEYGKFFDLSKLGGITTKAITLEAKQGNKSPRIVETSGGMLNAIGLQNAGVKYFIQMIWPFLDDLARRQTHVIINVSGNTIEEYVRLVEILSDLGVEFIEVNISCPNIREGGVSFGQSTKMAAEVTKAVKKVSGKSKIILKLTPNVTSITEIAKAVEAAGADAVSLINTLVGMRINPVNGRFALSNKTGGYSGPPIFPIALNCVYQTHKAVKIPIIGMGGVSSGEDVVEMMRAGATLVGIGTANFTDVDNQKSIKIIRQFEQFCENIQVLNATDLIGATY